jgi:hypothetical protein
VTLVLAGESIRICKIRTGRQRSTLRPSLLDLRPAGPFFADERVSPDAWRRPGFGANDGMSGGQVSLAREIMSWFVRSCGAYVRSVHVRQARPVNRPGRR